MFSLVEEELGHHIVHFIWIKYKQSLMDIQMYTFILNQEHLLSTMAAIAEKAAYTADGSPWIMTGDHKVLGLTGLRDVRNFTLVSC